ncbi:MAG: AMP-binding protein [Lachnospiraceae bacterium]|nr:AMP-binding protein [Lachnospiraceae bacterium]
MNGISYSYIDYRNKLNDIFNRYKNKTAVTYMRNSGEDNKVSYNDMHVFISNAVKEFETLGLTRSDRAAIIAPHSPWTVLMGMALTYYGVTIALIDASLPQKEIEKLFVFSDVKALFTTQKIYDCFDKKVIDSIPCFSLDNGLKIQPFELNSAKCSEIKTTVNTDDDVIAILYSSGTTGEMKGSMVTYESVIKARDVFARLAGLEDYMTYMLVLPFNHIAGFTGAMTYFLTGCELGFIEDVNASKLQNGLLKFQPYYFAMVPKVYEVMEQKIRAAISEKGKIAERLMNCIFKISKFFRKNLGINIGRKMFKSITAQVFGENIYGIGTGASLCKAETTEFFLNLGLEWANLYATTETGVPIVATGIHDRYPVGTVGNVKHHPEIKVIIKNPDNDGNGEICVKSELMMKGYFRRPDLTESAFDNGYFKTGDYGYIDKKGYLYITGRIKESIVLQNGKKVSPSDVDDYYLSKISDYDIASRGIVDENGQYDEIHMFVADKAYTADEQKTIRESFLKISRTAPSMYRLSKIHFIPDIPRTSVGKVKRFCLTVDNEIQMMPNTYKNEDSLNQHKSDKQNVPDMVCMLIASIVNMEQENIKLDMRLKKDIGMDSLGIFEMGVAIDEKYNVSVEPYLRNDVTVAEIVNIVENKNDVSGNAEDITQYPIKRSEKDYKNFDRFMRLSKFIYSIEVTGTEHINPDEKYIFCPNHESYFDGMWIIGNLDNIIKQSICSVAADHLFEKKIYRKGLIFMGGIPVHRSGNTTTALKRAYECIVKEGYSVLIHPEGTRTRSGELGEFKQGAAKLSVKSGIKIIPVCINGAYEVFPPHRKLPRLFDWRHFRKYPLQIKFGVPIAPDNRTAAEITSEIKHQIVDMKKALKG